MLTDTLLLLFQEEVHSLEGRVSDALNDGQRLFARAVLPADARVSGNDVVHSGVALRYMNGVLDVRPYVYRVVCRNGAIAAFSGQGRSIDLPTPDYDTEAIRQAIHAAAAPETFAEFVNAMRQARSERPDPAIFLLALGRHGRFSPPVLLDILARYRSEGEPTLYALANAVTSLARDTRDPVERWDREVVGADIFARIVRLAPARRAHATQPDDLQPV